MPKTQNWVRDETTQVLGIALPMAIGLSVNAGAAFVVQNALSAKHCHRHKGVSPVASTLKTAWVL